MANLPMKYVGNSESMFPGSLSNYRQLYWTLKPLFFEVPTGESSAGFVGRQWLYREISEHLTSDLPTNRGVIVAGNPATGKTAAILQLVENRGVLFRSFALPITNYVAPCKMQIIRVSVVSLQVLSSCSCFGRGSANCNGDLAARLLPADVDSVYGHSQLSLGLQHQAKFHASQQQVRIGRKDVYPALCC